jgi:D-alanyl-lipoteichoic acid acyltransferase DltB (MBOAT superfamily)
MLFNSYDFIFGLLPLTWLAWNRAMRQGVRASLTVLVISSLIYYGWWYPPYLALFLASMVFNFQVGLRLGDERRSHDVRQRWLYGGVALNLTVLGVYKYLGWITENVNAVAGTSLPVLSWALPVGISFFTFQQIAYLVDARRGECREHDWLSYSFFVAFFPQLIAGPIVHHGEILPQVQEGRRPTHHDVAVAFTFFTAGLAKKLLIADQLVPLVDALFGGVHQGEVPTTWACWTGLFAWHFQLYFDFSGYSDMAIGLGRLFGVKLPVNFEAPYRADSMQEFWRRWHVTLSRFLRDYLYISLGGNRGGSYAQMRNQFFTLLLAGMWHGAGWTYFWWGFMMGALVVVQMAMGRVGLGLPDNRVGVGLGRLTMWTCMMFSWPLFRGLSLADASVMWQAMVGVGEAGIGRPRGPLVLAFLLLTIWSQVMPTMQQFMRHHDPAWNWKPIDRQTGPAWLVWHPTTTWAVVFAVIFAACVPVLDRAGAFLYWNF